LNREDGNRNFGLRQPGELNETIVHPKENGALQMASESVCGFPSMIVWHYQFMLFDVLREDINLRQLA